MKIISQTSNEIRIEKTSSKGSFKDNLYFFLLVFFVFPFVPLVFFLFNILPDIFLIGVTRVICDRVEPQQVDCQVSKSKFFDLARVEPVSMKFVQSAKYNLIQSEDIEGRKTYKYNFQFINKFGEVRTFDSHQESANQTIESVNSFLISQQTSLKYITDDRTNPMLIIGLLFALGINLFILFICFKIWLFILRTCSEKEIILNKSKNSFIYIQNRFILGKKIDDYKFTDVAKVDVLYANASYDNIVFAPRITMTSGVKYNLDTIGDRQAAINVANDLNRFIGLPEEEDPVVKG
jgi:hypothetical protein